MTEKMRVKFPRYSVWLRTLDSKVDDILVRFGCEIISSDDISIDVFVPDNWHFIITDSLVRIFDDKEHTTQIGMVKMHINTGRWMTIMDEAFIPDIAPTITGTAPAIFSESGQALLEFELIA